MNRVENWLCFWADMVVALFGIITITLYQPNWDFELRAFFVKRNLKKRIERQSHDKQN